ncbi:RNA polymerase sigma factor [Alicyclobacillus sp. ALC3]|uniref:RNA polymerase sigma factor n=1 Tax=Alicyclobacillus sp. ALC3 TaxID=2796143 RepID=UPI002379A2B3|nr:sigma-70 family RNA polymerase sigma factor [Alicyclobacillus sp. ALC3]WDL98618.1 sigma-70 family RNA polymerase sigma factor [Alicyclobacillus sp. ALC3]
MTNGPVTFPDAMRQYWQSVWSFAYSIVRRIDVADDLAQETFIRAYEHWADYRGESSLKTWLFTIARNAATDYLRSAGFRRLIPFANPSGSPDVPLARNRRGDGHTAAAPTGANFSNTAGARDWADSASPSAEVVFLDGESVNDIWRAVLELGRNEREVILLRVREQLSFREVADVVGTSEGNARVLYFRAIRKLKTKLQAEVLADEL